MRRDITDPPGITSEAESYDRLTCIQAIRGLAERIQIDKVAIGEWFVRLKKACQHGQWLDDLKELGVPERTVRDWMEKAKARELGEYAGAATFAVADALAVADKTEDEPTTSGDSPTPQQGKLFQAESQPAAAASAPPPPTSKAGRPLYCETCKRCQRVGQVVPKSCVECKKLAPVITPGGQATAGGDQPAPEAGGGAPDVGDAAEALPPGTILDPEGDPLPPAAQELFAGAAELEAVVKELRSVVGHLRKLPAIPGGSFVPVQVTEKLLRAVWRMVWNHRLDKDNAYRCDGYEQRGCAGAGCSKCKGLGVVPKPLYGETPAKPKPKRPWGGRR